MKTEKTFPRAIEGCEIIAISMHDAPVVFYTEVLFWMQAMGVYGLTMGVFSSVYQLAKHFGLEMETILVL